MELERTMVGGTIMYAGCGGGGTCGIGFPYSVSENK